LCVYITVLEVYQFARDAAVAEAWLIAQEPYLMNQELGVSQKSSALFYTCNLKLFNHFCA